MGRPQSSNAHDFPLGAAVTIEQLDADPHRVHHRLRPTEPVSWLPCLDGWLVTSHALALQAMRDAASFTVDDPRFSTAQVIGPSMLSLDGPPHDRHRAPFVAPFRAAQVDARFADAAARRARRLIDAGRGDGRIELRRGFAGPMAASIIARALGMGDGGVGDGDEGDGGHDVLDAYDAIVASVTSISAGEGATDAGRRAYERLRDRLQEAIDGRGESLLAAAAAARTVDGGNEALDDDAIASNAAVLLFGGIETTEGMIATAALELLRQPDALRRVRDDAAALDAAIDESLRLEPAAAVVDRYATRDTRLGDAAIAAGDLVRISIAGANRDPSPFDDPDRYEPRRTNLRRHLAFAQGPHVCVGVHLARLEARAALRELIALPGLQLDPDRPPPATRGLIFRKPDAVHVRWDLPRRDLRP